MQTTRNQAWSTGRLAAPAAVALGLLLGGCLTPDTTGSARQVSLPEPPPQRAAPPTAAQREHERILASYNGAYQDPKLDAVLNSAVEKLVAASERPDQRYRVTVLNSSAVNAFALPSGHLYVTRGLISLANDTSELASVLSHEMAHVIASHAAMREDRARQVALVGRVFDNFGAADPDMHALALAKSKIALATFSRSQELEADGIGVGIAARAGYDPFGAVRFLSSLGRQAELRPPSQSATAAADGRMPDFLSSHPATPERVRNAQINARQFTGPGGGNRDREAYLAGIDGMLYGEDPSEGYVRGRRFLHPRLGFTFMAPEGFTLDNTPQAVLGIKDGGGQALRLDVVRVPAEQTLTAYLNSGWIENIDGATVEDVTIGGFPAATARRPRRSVGVPAVRGPLRQRRLPLHLRDQADDAGGRPFVPGSGQQLPPHEHRRGGCHQAAAHPHGAGRAKATPSSASPPAWRPTARRSGSASSTASAPPTACARAIR